MLIGLSPVLTEVKKHARAVKGFRETNAAFQALSQSLTNEQIESWGKQEEDAMNFRGEALRVYDVKSTKGNIMKI